MKRIPLLFLGALFSSLVTTQSVAEDERPNILVVLADDLGYGDLGFTGSTEIQTPRIDRLAEEGMVLRNGYVTHPYCGPSRAGLLTGRYQARFGMENNCSYSPYDHHMGLPVNEQTIADRLKAVGYRTGIIGKWHLGAAPPFHPNNRGFDYFYGFLAGGHCYFPEDVSTSKSLFTASGQPDYMVNEGGYLPLSRNEQAATFDEYLTTAMSRDAARFVNEGDEPFFLFLSYNAPHAPLEAPAETIAKYSHIENPRRQIYAAMIDEMDRGIGMVVDALASAGKLDNTLIFFLSDNGGVYPESWMPNADWASNAPFRRGKVALTEGGIHVPFLVHWPAGLRKHGVFEGLVSTLDIAATAVALAGAETSDAALEGVDLIPYLNGEASGSPHPALFWRLEEADHVWAVRTERYKYLRQDLPGVGLSFFDLQEDPYEGHNLVGQLPESQRELARLWNEWNQDNMQNILQQAAQYQKSRYDFYERLYQQQLEQARTRKAYTIE
ncbi:sulfatase-like hydrolase/transferase [Pelagicoccus sp. SDUM812003]|uniref:sulfatase family protein n=1 Tax=Pelagicoccus sp. SDUM812003 TaxID=3041267 RepID=UPI002810906E|nr:sulfatase-like hydrolase/transferase [Pelagicoccus sp. SDUM812003]MDQ8201458.1 sulfatase-like hydrolase/transferase [Pelagicoccus sp. SDUM812003]